MASGLVFALALLASPTANTDQGEPLPAGAPTDPYQLTAWCYGAMGEWIQIYDRVKPDLRAIDKMFGSSVRDEQDPYASDMKAARDELKVLAQAVDDAEKASAQPISEQGVAAVKLGQAVWRPAEGESNRRLADAWLTWALPDKCDAVARDLSQRSKLLGKALTYNAATGDDANAVSPSNPAAPTATQASPPAAPTEGAAPVETSPAGPPDALPAPAPEGAAPPDPAAAPK